MDSPSEISWDNIVALENIPPKVGRRQIIGVLGRQGWITSIQFWKSKTGKRHGFVTFQEPEGARNCLANRQQFEPPLQVRPVNPGSRRQYRPPEESSNDDLDNADSSLEGSPSVVSGLALPSKPITPSHEPLRRSSRFSTQNGIQDMKTLAVPIPTQSIPNAPLWGTADPQIPNTFNTGLLGKAPFTSSSLMPTELSTTLLEERVKRGAETLSLQTEIQKLQWQLRDVKKDLGAASGDARRYRAERDDLASQLEQKRMGAEYYKAQTETYRVQFEELKRRLDHEGDTHRRHEEGLRGDLKRAKDDMVKWRKDCENQSLLLKQRQLELEETQQQLRNLIEAEASAKEQGVKNTLQSKRNIYEPEEGEVYETPRTVISTLHNGTSPTPGHKRLVMPALETAFLHLDEIATAALRGNGEKEQIGRNKRQKTTDDR